MISGLPVLYSFRRCPYAIRARLALHISGLQFELYEVSLKSKPPEMLALSPKGTVPVLVLPCGQVIDESLDIMRWALTRNSPHSDPENWLGNGSTSDMLALITDNDNKFKHALDRYKYPNRYPQESNGDLKAFAAAHRSEAARWLAELESHLNQGWLCGPQASLADMATLPFVRQFAHIDTAYFVTQPWPKLQAWLARFEASTLFDSVMGKHAAHKTASLHYY